ncbi:MAG: adenylate/guanylate cyclase domain-containing protein, partial [Dehalococcoidia bacterium]
RRGHPLSQTLGELSREGLSQRILLRGLSERDVARFIEITAGIEPPQALVEAVYRETEGNPFFVNEIVRLLVADGRLERPEEVKSWSVTIPHGVREVVGRRLDHLSEECNGVLTVASVIGREFGLDALERVANVTGDRLLEVLEEAGGARVVAEVPRAVGRYSFTHALIRETLYEELGTTRRVRLHRQIGEALEAIHGDNLEPHLAELAHHFSESVQGGDVDKAIEYATRAGERATSLTAYEDAAGNYEMALQAREAKDEPDEAQHFELLLALGEALNSAGDRDKAKETLQQATAIARRLKDSDRLARAALGVAGPWMESAAVDELVVSLAEEALHALGDATNTLRARLLGRLAMEFALGGSPGKGGPLSREAVDVARRVGDPMTLAATLYYRFYALGRENIEERLAIGTEMLELAEELGDRPWTYLAHFVRRVALVEQGDIGEGDREFEVCARLAEEIRQPRFLAWMALCQTMRALQDGRFNDAERLAHEALTIGERAQDSGAVLTANWQIFALREEQGRLEEVEADIKGYIEQFPEFPTWRASLALLHSELGREAEARRELELLAANDFADLARDPYWLTTGANLAQVCAHLGDEQRASRLYDQMLPYAHRNAITVPATGSSGSTSRYLGLLAATMERWKDAARHFEDALEMNAKMGARPWVAYTQHDYAGMLLARHSPGDREKALELVTQALDSAQEMGMKALVEKALTLKLRAQGIDTTAPQTSIDAVLESVHDEQPDLRTHAAPDGTVTILFSDIEGSTAMTERLGDKRWLELLRGHNAIVREQLAAHEGFEVKAEGDGFMLAFGSARRALQCAVDIQRAFAARNESADEPIMVRIGLHTGEALKEADDFFGKNVILAARIAGQAGGGEILVSSLLKELTESGGDIAFGDGREVELKGLSGQHHVFEVVW